MAEPIRVEVEGLSKRFGDVEAVRSLSFAAEPGRVTGFLGPNGSGKTTTLSMVLGLVRPDSGSARVGGVPYTALERPGLTVGASLSADFHPAHTGRAHLDIARRAIGVPQERADELLQLVGLAEAADRKTGGYSLGMRQRLALAAALLGDPRVLLLDEPNNSMGCSFRTPRFYRRGRATSRPDTRRRARGRRSVVPCRTVPVGRGGR